jgi:hypothetical protein
MVSSAGVTFGPRKLATIFTLTREMVESSNAEQLVRMVMAESLSVALDVALFSNVAGDSVRPARPVGRNHADRRGTDRGDRTKWARQTPIGVFQLRRSVAR